MRIKNQTFDEFRDEAMNVALYEFLSESATRKSRQYRGEKTIKEDYYRKADQVSSAVCVT
jgi:hypothetical protein